MEKAESEALVSIPHPMSLLDRMRANRKERTLLYELRDEEERIAKETHIAADWIRMCPKYGKDGPYPIDSIELADAITRLEEICEDVSGGNYDDDDGDDEIGIVVTFCMYNYDKLPHLTQASQSFAAVRLADLKRAPENRVEYRYYKQASKQLRDGFIEKHPEFEGLIEVTQQGIFQPDPSVLLEIVIKI